QKDSFDSEVWKKSPKCTSEKLPSAPVNAIWITRTIGTTRKASRKRATSASAAICAGLAPSRDASGARGAAGIVAISAMRYAGLFGACRFFRERLRLRIVLERGLIPLLLELGLTAGGSFALLY